MNAKLISLAFCCLWVFVYFSLIDIPTKQV